MITTGLRFPVYFKTTTVGLRPPIRRPTNCGCTDFKTTTVGLRQGDKGDPGEKGDKFQNHYGWIETYVTFRRGSRMGMFQNHYGWIETASR